MFVRTKGSDSTLAINLLNFMECLIIKYLYSFKIDKNLSTKKLTTKFNISFNFKDLKK